MRPPEQYAAVHNAANYYEPLMRVKIVRAIKALRKTLTLQHMVTSMQSGGAIVPRKQLEQALQPAAKVMRDAFNHGGKVGATRVNEVLK